MARKAGLGSALCTLPEPQLSGVTTPHPMPTRNPRGPDPGAWVLEREHQGLGSQGHLGPPERLPTLDPTTVQTQDRGRDGAAFV